DSVSRNQIQIFSIPEKFFTTIFETHFNNGKLIFCRHIHIGKPVEHIHLITSTSIAGTVVFTTGYCAIFSSSTCTSHPANLYNLSNPDQYPFCSRNHPS